MLQISILLHVITLCSCQSDVNIDFSNTEWISDSLNIQDESQLKEFIYFDSIGNFTRATWWSENYILDRGKFSSGSIQTKKAEYQIQIIDSFNIKLSKENYEGFFYGNPWREDKYFSYSLNRFVVGDSIKKELIGNWIYERNEIELGEHLKLYDEIPEYAEKKLKRVAQRRLDKSLNIKFTKDNRFIAENLSEGKIVFSYIVDEQEINISRSDYVISIDYKLSGKNELEITKKYQTMGISRTYFKRESTEANKR